MSLSEQLKTKIKKSKKTKEEKELIKAEPFSATVSSLSSTQFINNNKSIKVSIPSGRGVKAEDLEIKFFEKNVGKILDRSIIFYGPSGTGKTRYIHNLMYLTRANFPKVFIFAPTNTENHDYDGIVPDLMIFEEFNCEDIKRIYESQKASASTYNKANKIEILKGLFDQLAESRDQAYVAKLESKCHEKLEVLSEKEQKSERGDYFKKFYNDKKVQYLKKIIQERYKSLDGKITEDEAYCIRYMNHNPRILVIFDDAINELKTIMKLKKDGDIIKNFFFKGRFAYITHFYAFQDETGIDTGIKKNCFFSIFTNDNVARGFFSKASSNFGVQDKARAMAAIDAIFPSSETDLEKKYNKLVYARMEKIRFQYTIADEHAKFRMCDNNVWKFCELATSEQDELDKNNPYLKGFGNHL